MSGSADTRVAEVAATLRRVLQLAPDARLGPETRLLGGIPEFDSLAVASVVIALEEQFELSFDDEDITAELFDTVGSLAAFVSGARQTAGGPAISAPAIAAGPPAASTAPTGPRPEFLSATSGRLFLIRRDPPAGPGERCVLFVPPFAEELNRVRPILTAAAVALNAAGLSTCLADLHGTGDSDGDFGAAAWSVWLTDLHDVVTHLQARGWPGVDLVAVRLGARLAADYCRAHRATVARVVWWDPLLDGAAFLERFLRTRTMAAMMAGRSESVASLRARLAAGETLEVGGYALHPRLAAELADMAEPSAPDPPLPGCCIVSAATPRASAVAERLGIDPAALLATGHEPYWDNVEVSAAPALVAATRRCLTTADD